MNQLKGIWRRESEDRHITALSLSSLERDSRKDLRILRNQLAPPVLYVLFEYFTPSISLGEDCTELRRTIILWIFPKKMSGMQKDVQKITWRQRWLDLLRASLKTGERAVWSPTTVQGNIVMTPMLMSLWSRQHNIQKSFVDCKLCPFFFCAK